LREEKKGAGKKEESRVIEKCRWRKCQTSIVE
jgi:hypothetical protein